MALLFRLTVAFLCFVSLAGLKFSKLGRRGNSELTASQRSKLKIDLDECRARLKSAVACLNRNPFVKYPTCKQSTKGDQLKQLRVRCAILEGVWLVDTTVHKGDPPKGNSGGRQKRMATHVVERSIDAVGESLKKSIDASGVAEPIPQLDRKRSRRGSCNLTPRSDHSTRAVRMGKTIESSIGGSVGIIISTSTARGYVYGQNGEFGCMSSHCSGLEADAGAAVTVTEGYYYNFNDVAGQSKIYLGSVPGYSFGVVYSLATGARIGYMSSAEAAADLAPVSAGVFYCDTEVVRGPSCRVTYGKYTEAVRSWGRLSYRKRTVKSSICD